MHEIVCLPTVAMACKVQTTTKHLLINCIWHRIVSYRIVSYRILPAQRSALHKQVNATEQKILKEMNNSPANESGCADHRGEGCGCDCSCDCSCVPSDDRASSCGAVHGATPATWTGDRRGDGSRRDLGTCPGADRRLHGEGCGCGFESESGNGASGSGSASRERAGARRVRLGEKGNGRMGHLDLLLDLRCRHFGSGSGSDSGLIDEEDCGCGFVLGDSAIESESV